MESFPGPVRQPSDSEILVNLKLSWSSCCPPSVSVHLANLLEMQATEAYRSQANPPVRELELPLFLAFRIFLCELFLYFTFNMSYLQSLCDTLYTNNWVKGKKRWPTKPPPPHLPKCFFSEANKHSPAKPDNAWITHDKGQTDLFMRKVSRRLKLSFYVKFCICQAHSLSPSEFWKCVLRSFSSTDIWTSTCRFPSDPGVGITGSKSSHTLRLKLHVHLHPQILQSRYSLCPHQPLKSLRVHDSRWLNDSPLKITMDTFNSQSLTKQATSMINKASP